MEIIRTLRRCKSLAGKLRFQLDYSREEKEWTIYHRLGTRLLSSRYLDTIEAYLAGCAEYRAKNNPPASSGG